MNGILNGHPQPTIARGQSFTDAARIGDAGHKPTQK